MKKFTVKSHANMNKWGDTNSEKSQCCWAYTLSAGLECCCI